MVRFIVILHVYRLPTKTSTERVCVCTDWIKKMSDDESDPREQLLKAHRKEKKDLQAKIQGLKKTASKGAQFIYSLIDHSTFISRQVEVVEL